MTRSLQLTGKHLYELRGGQFTRHWRSLTSPLGGKLVIAMFRRASVKPLCKVICYRIGRGYRASGSLAIFDEAIDNAARRAS